MRKLNKKNSEALQKHIEDVDNTETELRDAIDKYNEVLADEWQAVVAAYKGFVEAVGESEPEVRSAKEAFDAAVSEAESFREEMSSEIEGHYDEKSERWQESEAGERFSEWSSTWQETIEPEEIEIPELKDLEEISELTDLEKPSDIEYDGSRADTLRDLEPSPGD